MTTSITISIEDNGDVLCASTVVNGKTHIYMQSMSAFQRAHFKGNAQRLIERRVVQCLIDYLYDGSIL